MDAKRKSIILRTIGSIVVVGAIGFVTLFAVVIVGLASINFDPSATQTTGTGVWVVVGVIAASGLAGIAASLRSIWSGFPKRAWRLAFALVLLVVAALFTLLNLRT